MPAKNPTDIAAAQAAHWRARVADLTGLIANATRSLAEADDERRTLAVAAASGDAKAVARLAELRRLKAETEASLDDLRMALGEADRQTKAAEEVHARAVRQDLLATARALADRRIEAARKFDDATRMMGEALADWTALGEALMDMQHPAIFQVGGVGGSQGREAVMGSGRLERAFPAKVVRKVFPAACATFPGDGSLAASEAAQWADLPAA
jgi:hypothetical protein